MHIEVVCSRCNYVIYRMRILRAIKDIIKDGNRCPHCNAVLTHEFTVDVEKI